MNRLLCTGQDLKTLRYLATETKIKLLMHPMQYRRLCQDLGIKVPSKTVTVKELFNTE